MGSEQEEDAEVDEESPEGGDAMLSVNNSMASANTLTLRSAQAKANHSNQTSFCLG